MELYLQVGYGMMAHCRALLRQWRGGTAILSPRDLDARQLKSLADDLNALPGSSTLLDPQFYLPRADHYRLCSHSYWPSSYQTGVFWHGSSLKVLLSRLTDLNRDLGCDAMILPGMFAERIDQDWLDSQQCVIARAQSIGMGLPTIATIALSADVVQSEHQISLLLEASEQWETSGYYIVCEHPAGQYLVDDPTWVGNLVDLAAGFRLYGAKVILGYCNQQILISSIAKVNAIASGTWMNVRSFSLGKFKNPDPNESRQRSTWYYCPQVLSEYKIPFLDLAARQNVLSMMAPDRRVDRGDAARLFSGVKPSSNRIRRKGSLPSLP